MSGRPAVFLDKDGTLLDDLPFNVAPERMRLAPGVADGLAVLAGLGVPLIVVSNQPGVAWGYFPVAALAGVRARLARLFAAAGARLTDFLYCPHAPVDAAGGAGLATAAPAAAPARPAASARSGRGLACVCRKPAPGMFYSAAARHAIDLSASWMIGDILDDVEAGRRAGCRTILIDRGGETEWHWSALRRPDLVVPDFAAAAHSVALLTPRGLLSAPQQQAGARPLPDVQRPPAARAP